MRITLGFVFVLLFAGCNQLDPVSITSIFPVNGATGVKADASIVVTFSGAANRSAVEASYKSDSEGIKPDQVNFSWNTESNVLTIFPKKLLATIDNSPLEATRFTFSLLNQATSGFVTYQEKTMTLFGTGFHHVNGNSMGYYCRYTPVCFGHEYIGDYHDGDGIAYIYFLDSYPNPDHIFSASLEFPVGSFSSQESVLAAINQCFNDPICHHINVDQVTSNTTNEVPLQHWEGKIQASKLTDLRFDVLAALQHTWNPSKPQSPMFRLSVPDDQHYWFSISTGENYRPGAESHPEDSKFKLLIRYAAP